MIFPRLAAKKAPRVEYISRNCEALPKCHGHFEVHFDVGISHHHGDAESEKEEARTLDLMARWSCVAGGRGWF